MDRIIYAVLVGKRRDIVLLLHKEGPLTLSKLRNSLGISASSLIFEISALESLGVVKREDSLVYLTELGMRVANIISTTEPMKSLNILSIIGHKSFVVWLLISPHLRLVATLILSTWIFTLVLGSFLNPPLTLLGVVYTGYYLLLLIIYTPEISLLTSLTSAMFVIVALYLYSRGKITPYKTVVGLAPLAIYPSLHLSLVQLAKALEYSYLIVFSQILLFITLLLSAFMLATVYSIEMGTPYESSLVYTLLIFFIGPALFHIFQMR